MKIESLVVKDDFPMGVRDFVDVVGIDIVMEIIDYCGGSMIYFPSKKSVVRSARNRVINSKFNGGNYREISREFGISEMQVRNILKN